MKTQRNLIRSKTEYSHYYTDMGGVDFSCEGNSTTRRRFCDLENMYRDWDGDGIGATESIPGFRKIFNFDEEIINIYLQKTDKTEYLVICTVGGIYRIAIDQRDDPDAMQKLLEISMQSSVAFPCGGELYLLINKQMLRIAQDGEVSQIGDGLDITPYVPVTFFSGKALEQRNMLSNHFKEQYTLNNPENLQTGTDGLTYRISHADQCLCTLTGRGSCHDAVIYVPKTTVINNRVYTVGAIDDRAFENDTTLEQIVLPDTLTEIGYYAFSGCTALKAVVTGNDFSILRSSAFAGCTALEYLYLGKSLKTVGPNVTDGCSALAGIDCGFLSTQLSSISDYQNFADRTLYFDQMNPRLVIEIPIFSPASQITRVEIDGASIPFTPIYKDDLVQGVRMDFIDKRPILGATVTLHGIYHSVNVPPDNGFIAAQGGSEPSSYAILGCTVAELFDGRIFLSGNPSYPNTVFYSARGTNGINDPTYFGVLNYFNDGIGPFRVRSLLAVGNSLAVFKEDDDGSGSIYYHTPTQTGEDLVPKIYPVSYIHTGLCAKGETVSFYDDPIFVSENGICAITKPQINFERSIACRSHNVNIRLLSEDLSGIKLAKWRGYLVALANGHIYLADSRQTFRHEAGSIEYEWYYLSGIGTYRDDRTVYRYAGEADTGYLLHPEPDTVVSDTVYSAEGEGGKMLYFTMQQGKKYAVYPTNERRGGIFCPASVLRAVGDLLFFGTASGDLCVFNNDMRGIPPPELLQDEDFDAEAYALQYGQRIHPYFYDFANHAPTYKLRTPLDNCGIPHLTKNSVKGSLVLKCRAPGSVSMVCEVGTDRTGYREITSFPGGTFDFSQTSFLTLSLAAEEYFSVPIAEREKGWVEKQIGITSADFASPIALISIGYRFTIKGKLKKQ